MYAVENGATVSSGFPTRDSFTYLLTETAEITPASDPNPTNY